MYVRRPGYPAFLAPILWLTDSEWAISPDPAVSLLAVATTVLVGWRLFGKTVVVVGGWQLRNHSAVDSWQVSGIADVNLYCYNAAEAEASVAGISYDGARRRLGCPTEYPNPKGLCTRSVGYGCWMPDPDAPGQGFSEWGRKGLDIMRDHPMHTGRVLGEGVVREIAGGARSRVSRYLGIDTSMPLTIGLSSWVLALWSFAAVGVVAGLRSKHRAFWAFVIATIGYVILVSTGTAGDARFRSPLVPLIALLAALGIRHSLRRLGRAAVPPPALRHDRPVATAGSLTP